MPRRSEAEVAKGGIAARDKPQGTITTTFAYSTGAGRSFRGQNVNPMAFNRRTRNIPAQPAPLTPARNHNDPLAPTSTRKISASFSTGSPLSGHPTIACSDVTASTRMVHPGPLNSHPINRSSAFPSSQSHGNMNASRLERGIRSSHTCSHLPVPTEQYAKPSTKASVATAYTNAIVMSPCHVENIPPSTSMANLGADKQAASNYSIPGPVPGLAAKTKSRFRPVIPKSRTLTALSNLRASLSRTSLGFSGSDSRRTSTSSKSTVRKDPAPYMNPQLASSASSQALANSATNTTNIRQIHTAQSSAYWAGRFMALQDRFQSETLLPENLTTLVNAHANHSLLPIVQPSLATSATTSCIVPPNKSKLKSITPLKAPQQPKSLSKPRSEVAPKSLCSTATIASVRQSKETAAAMLVDEDNRCRRIFSHLDALCTTSEARVSLREWQQGYARRVGKESLLPKGGTMRGATKELTWVGRLLTGNSRSLMKRGSLGL
ncbi:hypothetical protein F4861DRAFT_302865 [Xylaria intraflava]|nr:hypothetical protein F4861DRAFT_302865 [Xylaria intraflava]